MAWDTNGLITDPSDNAILADTGAVGSMMTKDYCVLTSADAACELVLEHRNVMNTSNLHSHRINHNDPSRTVDLQIPITLGVGERLRVRLVTGFTGDIQGSLLS